MARGIVMALELHPSPPPHHPPTTPPFLPACQGPHPHANSSPGPHHPPRPQWWVPRAAVLAVLCANVGGLAETWAAWQKACLCLPHNGTR